MDKIAEDNLSASIRSIWSGYQPSDEQLYFSLRVHAECDTEGDQQTAIQIHGLRGHYHRRTYLEHIICLEFLTKVVYQKKSLEEYIAHTIHKVQRTSTQRSCKVVPINIGTLSVRCADRLAGRSTAYELRCLMSLFYARSTVPACAIVTYLLYRIVGMLIVKSQSRSVSYGNGKLSTSIEIFEDVLNGSPPRLIPFYQQLLLQVIPEHLKMGPLAGHSVNRCTSWRFIVDECIQTKMRQCVYRSLLNSHRLNSILSPSIQHSLMVNRSD